MDIFGRSGAKLITLLNGGSESLEKFSVNVSDNFAKNAELFNDQIAEIGIKFAEVGAVLLDAMLPALNAVALGFKTFLENVTNNLPVILEAFGFMTKAAILFGSAMVGVAAGKAFTALITNLNTVVKITRTLFNLEKARLVIQQGIIALQAASASLGKGGKIGAVLGIGAGAAAIAGSQQLIGELFKSIEERFAGLGAGGAGTGLGAVTLPDTQFSPIVTGGTGVTGGAASATKEMSVDLAIFLADLEASVAAAEQLEAEQFAAGAAIAEQLNQQDKLNESTSKYKITLDQIKDTLANQMTSAIEGLIDGTKTLGESLSGLLRTLPACFCGQVWAHFLKTFFLAPRATCSLKTALCLMPRAVTLANQQWRLWARLAQKPCSLCAVAVAVALVLRLQAVAWVTWLSTLMLLARLLRAIQVKRHSLARCLALQCKPSWLSRNALAVSSQANGNLSFY